MAWRAVRTACAAVVTASAAVRTVCRADFSIPDMGTST
jgi:hypothetical protein